MILSDASAERATLAGILRYGTDAYYDVADILNADSFTISSNSMIYACVASIFGEDMNAKLDVPSILSVAKKLQLHDFFNSAEIAHLNAIANFPVLKENVRKFAAKVRKLQIARLMNDQLEEAQSKYKSLTGDESITSILSIAENAIFDFSSLLNDQNNDAPQKVFDDALEYLEELSQNPVDQVGIPTGLLRYDMAIGGGLRKGTVNVIGARPKTGKTVMAETVAINIAKNKVPVLILDTEMRKKDHQDRGLAMLSFDKSFKSTINEIETGQFSRDINKKKALEEVAKDNKDIPFYHLNIGGKSFEEQLAIMRRWLIKEVGLNEKGKAKDCVIVYDYLKLMESTELRSSDLKEFQLLGFMMTAMHNFALRYEVPFITFIQLNRDGISKETTDTASGSDRVIWLCSNFSIYKEKSDEEIAKDGVNNGNRKLVPVISRHGEGLMQNDYINILMHKKYAKIVEGRTALEIMTQGSEDDTDQNDSQENQVEF
jgi:replicative DNA helicase